MTIINTNTLNQTQLADVEQLIKTCQAHDKTYRTPYLSNMLNFDHNMPCFFLAYNETNLVGLLTVYADTPTVDLTLTVAPSYRRQGYAKRLFQHFLEVTKPYNLSGYSFIIEKHFLDKHPQLLERWTLEIDTEDREIWLGRDRHPIIIAPKAVEVTLAKDSDVEDIARFQSETFDTTFEVSYHYALEAIKDQQSLLYCLRHQGQILASCTVDLSSDINYLYGLAVRPSHRGQGLGSYLVSYLINDLLHQNTKAFQIAVDHDNHGARRLYEKLGFTYQTEVLYLNPKS